MIIGHFSDLHLEMMSWNPPKTDYDVVILNGDIHIGDLGVKWAMRSFPNSQVIYIPGNHEYYCKVNMELLHESLLKQTENTNVKVLIDDAYFYKGVNFIGSTLWSDFDILGDRELAMASAMAMIKDYKFIKRKTPSLIDCQLTPSDARNFHIKALKTIESLIQPDVKNFIATHYGIHKACSDPIYHDDQLLPAFVSDLSEFVIKYARQICGICYGHTHFNQDFLLGGVPVSANQRGYAPYQLCAGFKEDKCIEIS